MIRTTPSVCRSRFIFCRLPQLRSPPFHPTPALPDKFANPVGDAETKYVYRCFSLRISLFDNQVDGQTRNKKSGPGAGTHPRCINCITCITADAIIQPQGIATKPLVAKHFQPEFFLISLHMHIRIRNQRSSRANSLLAGGCDARVRDLLTGGYSVCHCRSQRPRTKKVWSNRVTHPDRAC